MHLLIYVTYPSAETAREISKAVIESRFAACANIFPAHESLYWWEGQVQSASETAVIYKTTKDKFEALRDKIAQLHPYDCPCIVALPIENGHAPFLQWIETETRG